MRDLVTYLAIGLIVLLTAALAGPWFIDWTAHRGWVESELTRISGTRVRVEGTLDLKLLPVPKLSLTQLRLGSNQLESAELSVARVRLELAPAALLRGELHFVDAELEYPQLSLLMKEDGHWHVPRLPAFSSTLVQIEKLNVKDGSLALRSASGRDPIVIGGIDFVGEATSLMGPYRGAGSLKLGNTPIKWRFSTAAIENDRLRAKIIMDESALQPRVELEGALAYEGIGAEATLSFEGQSVFSGTTKLAGQNVPWRLSGMMKAGHAGLRLDEAELRAGEDERALIANGHVYFDRQPTPKLQVTLNARQIDVDRLLVAPGVTAGRRMATLVSEAWADGGLVDSVPFAVEAKWSAPTALLAGETFTDLRGEAILVPREMPRLKFSVQGPARSALQLDGVVETGAAAAYRGRADVIARDIPRLAAYLALIDGEAARLRDLPFRSVEVSGDVEISAVGALGRHMRLRLDRSEFSGALAFTRAQGSERARLFADLTSDALDLEDLPELAGPARLSSDMDLSLALDARAVRLERLGASTVDAGRISLRLVKSAQDVNLEKLAIENIGGANVSAQGRFGVAGADVSARVDAQRLNDLANILQRLAPGAATDALAERAIALSPLKLDAQLRGRGLEAIEDLRIEGTARGTKLNLALKPTSGGTEINALAENNDAGLLLRQIGFDALPLNNPGPGRLQMRGSGQAQAGFTGAVSLSAARLDLTLEGHASGTLAMPDLRGTMRLRSNDASAFLRLSGFAFPDVTASLPFELSSALVASQGIYRFDNLSGLVAGSFVNGTLRSEATNQARRWLGQIKTDRLKLSALTALALGVQTAPPRGGIWAEQRFLPGLSDAPLLTLDLQVTDFDLAEAWSARDAHLRLRLEQGLVAIEQARMTWGEGTLSGELTLRRDGTSAALLAKGDFANLALPSGPVTGRISGHVELTSTGTSYATLAAGLAGEGHAEMDGLTIAAADPSAITRLISAADRGQVNIDERDLRAVLLREFERVPFSVGKRLMLVNAASGLVRLHSAETPRIALSFDARQRVQQAQITPVVSAPKNWTGEAPAATLIWQGRAGSLQRNVEAASLFNAISARAIQRESERAQALDEDIRERAAIQRRAKAFEFLRRRERELILFEQEERKRAGARR